MERIRFAAQTDVPALLSIYQQYIDTSITFEYTLPTPEEFARRVPGVLLLLSLSGLGGGWTSGRLCVCPPPGGADRLPVERGAVGVSGPGSHRTGAGRAGCIPS